MAMGSSLSPISIDIFMEVFEERALRPPHTLVIWPHYEVKLDFWLNLSPSLKLTIEKEINNILPFFDA